MAEVIQRDPDGNPRTVPVRYNDGPHKGLVVFHSPQEYERLTGEIVCPVCGELVTAHGSDCSLTRPCQTGC